MRTLLKKQGVAPENWITDKLPSALIESEPAPEMM